MSADRASQIIQSAERMIRSDGYQCFSFRNIATELGIKSSSVHYHFATKEDLAIKVVENYEETFFATLDSEETQHKEAAARLEHFITLFRQAITNDRLFCLCGMLGAEKAALPASVLSRVQHFFNRTVEWLVALQRQELDQAAARINAATLLSNLEGAMILAQTLEDDSLFDAAIEQNTQTFKGWLAA